MIEEIEQEQDEEKELDFDPVEAMKTYKQTHDIELRNKLVLYYLDAVKKSVMSMRSIIPTSMSYEEFVNQGVIALIDCIDKYEFNRGATFDTFIYKRLRGSVLSYLRKMAWLPYRVRQAKRNINLGEEELHEKLGRAPTSSELSEYLGISEKELDKLKLEIVNGEMYSFEEMLESTNYSQEHLMLKSDDGMSPESSAIKNELLETLANSIDNLSEREKQVISLCYYEELNLREIGEVLGVSQQRASFLKQSALEKLRKSLSSYVNAEESEKKHLKINFEE